MVKIHTAQESLKIHFGDRTRHRANGGDLGFQGSNAIAANGVSEEGDSVDAKDTFVPVDCKAGSSKALQELTDM